VVRRCTAILVLTVAVAGCGKQKPRTTEAPPSGRLVLRGGAAAALAASPDGSLLVGFLRSGTIWRVPVQGRPRREYPRLRVSANGQRGLLSLVVVERRVYASWTTPGRRLVVARLRHQAAPVVIWRGISTATLANGGHLAAATDGRLVIGIGDRQSGSPTGRLLSLDPSGPATQTPRTLSTGWNNPFAFTFTPGDELWVADNAPGRRPERLARGDDAGGRPAAVTTLVRRPAASGLVALDADTLALCGVVSGTLDRYRRRGTTWHYDQTLARGCRYGVARLADGRLAFGAEDDVRVVAP
jgi:hypothetical protein